MAQCNKSQEGHARATEGEWSPPLPPTLTTSLCCTCNSDEALSFFKGNQKTDLLVIVDDIHLPCGTIRFRANGSTGGHNGLTDISNHLSGGDWSRLRVGVDEPGLIPQADYVLGKFTPEQKACIEPALSRSVTAAMTWINAGIDEAMNLFNETQQSETTR